MNFKPLLFLPPVARGVLGFMWLTQPQKTAASPREPARLMVRVMTVAEEPLLLSATGYGRVEAVQT